MWIRFWAFHQDLLTLLLLDDLRVMFPVVILRKHHQVRSSSQSLVAIIIFILQIGNPSNISAYPAPHRARCNSILHLFGSWLFEAALLGSDAPGYLKPNVSENRLASPLLTDRSRASSVSVTSEASIPPNRPRSATVVEVPDVSNVLPVEAYDNGRAEALGALCRIFCAKKTDEDILPQYLARFYVVLNQALKMREVFIFLI